MNAYTPFWLFRIYRSPSHKAYEIYGNELLHDTDVTFLVWLGENGCNHIKLEEVAPPETGNTEDDTDEFNEQKVQQLIKKYLGEGSLLYDEVENGGKL